MKALVIILLAASLYGAQTNDETPELVLDGVIVAANPSDSIALVRLSGKVRARPVRIGQTYGGFTLVEVSSGTAILSGAGREMRLSLHGVEPSTEAVASVSSSTESVANVLPADEAWVRRTFERGGTESRLDKEMPVILADTELVPRLEEGAARGIEVVRLPDGTVLAEAGLLPGDVVTSINGEPLADLDSLWEILAKFADADELRVVVERRGEVVRFAYALVN